MQLGGRWPGRYSITVMLVLIAGPGFAWRKEGPAR